MIVSILPAAQLSQIELLFTPYTHDKMHFSFFIRYRFSDFFLFDCCCQSLFFLHASQSESCWWGVLVVAPWAVIILTQHVDDITWLSPIPLTKLPSSERYNHPADLPDFLVKDVNIISGLCWWSRSFSSPCKPWAATSDRKKFLNNSGTCTVLIPVKLTIKLGF